MRIHVCDFFSQSNMVSFVWWERAIVGTRHWQSKAKDTQGEILIEERLMADGVIRLSTIAKGESAKPLSPMMVGAYLKGQRG